jgi:hypothetical protein
MHGVVPFRAPCLSKSGHNSSYTDNNALSTHVGNPVGNQPVFAQVNRVNTGSPAGTHVVNPNGNGLSTPANFMKAGRRL